MVKAKIKDTCKKCRAWTPEATGNYKCYAGSCPAKVRDDEEKKIRKQEQISRNKNRKAKMRMRDQYLK